MGEFLGNKHIETESQHQKIISLSSLLASKLLSGTKNETKFSQKNKNLLAHKKINELLAGEGKYVYLNARVGKKFSFRLPTLPEGYLFLVDHEGTYILDDNGNFIIVPDPNLS